MTEDDSLARTARAYTPMNEEVWGSYCLLPAVWSKDGQVIQVIEFTEVWFRRFRPAPFVAFYGTHSAEVPEPLSNSVG